MRVTTGTHGGETRGTTGTHLGNHNCKQLSFSGLAQVRCCNVNLKTPFESQKNEHDQELTRVEATLGMRGAGASLLTSTPSIPWRAQLEHCEKEERATGQGDGGLQARSGEWEAGECG